MPEASAAPIQTVSPTPGGAGHFAALRRSIFCTSTSNSAGLRNPLRRLRQLRRIGDEAVADAKRALGRFDQTVREFEGLGRR